MGGFESCVAVATAHMDACVRRRGSRRRVSGATLDVRERLEFTCDVARAAGEEVRKRYGDERYRLKAASSPVTEADLAANRAIVSAIGAQYPSEAILSEESKDASDRLAQEVVWIVDPLDGTKEFLAGNGEFAVMIGLVVSGEPVMGVVYAPAPDVLYAAGRGEGAWLETKGGAQRRLHCTSPALDRLRLVGSRSHAEPALTQMQAALGITDVRPSGSVGIKCGLIAEGMRDLYIHPVPYLREWDTCAPEVVVTEAGGRVTDCLGEPLRYNKREPVQPHGIVACEARVSPEILARITPIYLATRTRAGDTAK
jgi:3'(2'), 5'-bisphosphate nucleotidase